jgi:two-component system sensor histidine kinase YesM
MTSIRTRLLLSFLALLAVPVVTLGILGPVIYSRSIETQAVDHTLRMIAQVDKNLEYHVRGAEKLIALVAAQPAVASFFSTLGTEDPNRDARVLAFLDSCAQTHSEIAGILLVAANDRLLSDHFDRITRDPLVLESWYLKATARPRELTIIARPIGRNVRSRLDLGADDVVSVVKPVLDPIGSGGVLGVVMVDLRLDRVEELLADSSLGRDGYLYISDAEGELVYAPVNPTVYRIAPRRLSGGEGRTVRRVGDELFQVLYKESSYTGWTTAGVFSLRGALREVALVRWYALVVGGITVAFAMLLSVFFASSIARPVVKLRSLMKRAETGDFEVYFDEERDDEIGQLGRSFNAMIEEIRNLIEQVYREQQRKREAELRVLQEQIKPHFLYNTLDTIQWMAQEHHADDIVSIVGALTRLFRIGLSRGREMILVEDEIRHAESYLCIQKARYEDKFEYSIHVGPGLEGCRVLKLVLQPLVENAIYHGVKERRGAGKIEVEARRESDAIIFVVRDDGVGMTADRLAELRASLEAGSPSVPKGSGGQAPHGYASADDGAEKAAEAATLAAAGEAVAAATAVAAAVADGEWGGGGSGFGARNVHERIRLSFGESYGLLYESERGRGTTVTVRQPVVEEDE